MLFRSSVILALAATVSAAQAGSDLNPKFTRACYDEVAPFATKTAAATGTAAEQLKAETDLFRQVAAATERAQTCYVGALDAAFDAQRAGRPLTTVKARVSEVREGLAFAEAVFSEAERKFSGANNMLTASIVAELAPAAGGDAAAADPSVADAQATMADASNAFDLGPEMFERQIRIEKRLGKIR